MAVGVGKIAAEVAAGRAALIDVRPDEEWHESHAAPALHFELDRMMGGEMPPIPRDMPVYLYCRSGGRSEAAKQILEGNGFLHVTNLGGLGEWQEGGGAVAR